MVRIKKLIIFDYKIKEFEYINKKPISPTEIEKLHKISKIESYLKEI